MHKKFTSVLMEDILKDVFLDLRGGCTVEIWFISHYHFVYFFP